MVTDTDEADLQKQFEQLEQMNQEKDGDDDEESESESEEDDEQPAAEE